MPKTKEELATYQREYYKNNKDKVKARHKRYAEINKDYIKDYKKSLRNSDLSKAKKKERQYRLKSNYGITIEQYNELFEKQNGSCSICGKHQSQLEISLCVDHDHKTGKVRGLLCKKCNQALGLVNEDINIMKNMIIYLRKEF